MKLVTFQGAKGPRAGVVLDDGRYLCLATAAEKSGVDLDASSLLAIIQAGPAATDKVKALAARAAEFPDAVVTAASVKLRAPILKPERNVFCVGLNYVDHVAEGHRARQTEMKLPEVPTFFTKANNTINDPDADVRLDPKLTSLMDYEIELAVISKVCARAFNEKRRVMRQVLSSASVANDARPILPAMGRLRSRFIIQPPRCRANVARND